MGSNKRRGLFPKSKGGIPTREITLAEALKTKGYATACIGKWHLGHLKPFLPTSNGFDSYLGIPYSNDMDRVATAPKGRAAFLNPKIEYWNVPLMHNTDIIERPAEQTTITRRYTEAAIEFIEQKKDQPFFLYLPHSLPHVPLFRSKAFAGQSRRGLYGDVIEEIDWSVGQVLNTLKRCGIDKHTLVFFTSDNGPWLTFNEHGGSAGLLRDGKGSTWEGGMREPTLAWWPGTIKPASVSAAVSSTMDIYATAMKQANIPLPTDRTLDSHDLTPVLTGTGNSTRELLFYYRGYRLMAVRKGPWKMHLMTQNAYGQREPVKHDSPQLYHLEHDPSEKYEIGKNHPKVIADLLKDVKRHQQAMKPAPSQLEL